MPHIPIFLIIPLVAGFLCSLAFMLMKRALAEGMDTWRTAIAFNVAAALIVSPLLVFARTPGIGAAWYQPVIAGCLFFGGTFFWVQAINHGDVSLVGPLMGTKVLLVAFFTVILLGQPVEPVLWFSAVLVAVALAFLRGFGRGHHQHFWITVLLAMCGAVFYGLCDICFQAWAHRWGFGLFIPSVLVVVATFSVLASFCLSRNTSPPVAAWKWLVAGCVFNGLQITGMAISLSQFRHDNAATAINIVYNSRSISTVLLVWLVGHWFGNTERAQGPVVMTARAVGAALLITAIALTLLAA